LGRIALRLLGVEGQFTFAAHMATVRGSCDKAGNGIIGSGSTREIDNGTHKALSGE
jgi:hypothetical protein